ncbi:MAG: ABC transporter ATP-binding protein [Clostridiales bacterium]|nr:ABC transporter ATP-binding protein [Clostridiales bacterium]
MHRISKYLKKYGWTLLLIVALLGVQAVCDLALPTYTAAIVDVGIQQQGIEHGAPAILRESTLNTFEQWMRDTEVEEYVQPHYKPVTQEEASRLGVTATDEALLALDSKDQVLLEQLDSLFGKAMVIQSVISGQGTIDIGAMLSTEREDDAQSISIFRLPGMNLQNLTTEQVQILLASMTQDQREALLNQIDEALITLLPESMISQVAIQSVRAEYQTLGIDLGAMQSRSIWTKGIWMLLVALAGTAASVLVGYFGSSVAAKLGRDLREKLFHKVVNLGQQEMESFSTASLITRCTNDIQQVQQVMVFLLRMVIYAPILGVGGVIRALSTNLDLAWIILVGVLAVVTVVLVLYVLAMPRFKRMQSLIDKVNQAMRETITGLPVIRAFCTQQREEERFDEASTRLTKTQLFVNRLMSGMMPLMMLIMNGISILILWEGAHSIQDGTMQVGSMMAFIQYTIQIIMAFLMLSMMSVMLPRASVSAKRIQEVLDAEIMIRDTTSPVEFNPILQGVVEFRDVNFRYPGAEEDILSHISFTALPGQTTAILGGTGSGKSTLVNLIPRFYDVTGGQVLVDGVDVRQASLIDLRDRIGYVPQKGVLFSGTVMDNLTFGNQNTSPEQAVEAARIAQAEEFVKDREEGFESQIAQGGTNVSGGQKQRLSIARAIARDPEIYIFDDSFSALDYQTEVALRKELSKVTAHAAVLVVAQRISTVMNAEQILVLDEGRLVGKGTHRELMESCEVYQQIATSQLSKEELNNAAQ